MATITTSMSNEYLEMYKGYNHQAVGLGVLDPNLYASPAYQKKKIKNMLIGGISKIRYAGMENDTQPLVMTIGYEPAYATIIGFNLHYVPTRLRLAIMKFVLDSNVARIKANQPIIIDYRSLKRAVPQAQYIVRRYKAIAIHLEETIPLTEWPKVAKERSKWEGHFKLIQEGRVK